MLKSFPTKSLIITHIENSFPPYVWMKFPTVPLTKFKEIAANTIRIIPPRALVIIAAGHPPLALAKIAPGQHQNNMQLLVV